MSAPTDDINNLNFAHLSLDDAIEPLKVAVRKPIENMIKTAEKLLERNFSLKTVVLMDYPVRFDAAIADPTSVKPSGLNPGSWKMEHLSLKF